MAKKWSENSGKALPVKRKEILIGQDVAPDIAPKHRNGRPRGLSYRQRLFNEMVVPQMESIYRIAIAKALAGEESMIKLFIDRYAPKNPFEKPLEVVKDAMQQLELIMQQVASGDLAPDDAVKLSTIVKDKVTIGEVKAFMDRMKQFEAWVADQNQGVTFNGGMEEDGSQSKELDKESDSE